MSICNRGDMQKVALMLGYFVIDGYLRKAISAILRLSTYARPYFLINL